MNRINNEILEKVLQVLEEEFELERDQLTPDVNLFEDMELDSLDAVDLIVALEKLFGIRAEEERAKEIRTIRDVVSFVEFSLNQNSKSKRAFSKP